MLKVNWCKPKSNRDNFQQMFENCESDFKENKYVPSIVMHICAKEVRIKYRILEVQWYDLK